MIDRKVAENIKTVILNCVSQRDRSVKDAIEGSPEEQASMYRRLVGQVMGQLFTEILVPIYVAHPDLEPEELRKARLTPRPQSMPKETAVALMSVNTSVTGALGNLRADLSHISEENVRSLGLALQEPLDFLQDIRKFLLRACPEAERA
jgi:hypothetical protein